MHSAVSARRDFGASSVGKFSSAQVVKAFNLLEDYPAAVLQMYILLSGGEYGDTIALASILFSVRGIMFRIEDGGSCGDHQFGG